MPPKKLSLRAGEYEKSLNALRKDIDNQRTGYIDVTLQPPYDETEVHLQLRCTDLYIVGFGKGGQDGWYRFEGKEDEKDAWAANKPSCGVKSNYNNLGGVAKIDVSMVKKELPKLVKFKIGGELPVTALVIAIVVVSESLRFKEVAKQFTELCGWVGKVPKGYNARNSVEVGPLMDTYFRNWERLSRANDPGVLLKKLEQSASVASSSSG